MVTNDHVRELLESSADDAQLILESGRLRVVSAAELSGDASALVVGTAQELRDTHQLGDDVNESQLSTIAALLDDRVAKLGA